MNEFKNKIETKAKFKLTFGDREEKQLRFVKRVIGQNAKRQSCLCASCNFSALNYTLHTRKRAAPRSANASPSAHFSLDLRQRARALFFSSRTRPARFLRRGRKN